MSNPLVDKSISNPDIAFADWNDLKAWIDTVLAGTEQVGDSGKLGGASLSVDPNSNSDTTIWPSKRVRTFAESAAAKRVGQLMITKEKITISASNPWWNLANPTQALSATTYQDYAEYLRALLAETKWASTYETTGTTSGSPLTTLTLAASKTWAAGQIIFLAGQFRMIVSGSGTSYVIDEPITISSGKIWSISLASGVSNFPITGYSRTSNTVSVFANSDTCLPELYIMLMNLAEDYFQDRSYRTLTLPADIGSGAGLIPAGDYQILSVTPANVGTSSAIITFTYSGSDVSLTALTSKNLNFYPHRIAGSSNAMHYRIGDMALMNDGLYNISGYRARDISRGFQIGATADNSGSRNYWSFTTGRDYVWGSGASAANHVEMSANTTSQGIANMIKGVSNGIDGNFDTGPRGHPRMGIYNYYEFAGEVVA